ncbi:MAG: radical SAM protein [Clostridia bacterium]|nr:radical SAM protein [Clostridia bacterium]
MQKGFNYSQDGPGNRLVYHLQGCNLHCPWCSNPESMRIANESGISTDEMFKEILISEMMFFDGGGVTFTGGEPTVQFDALKEILAKVKACGINTAIETNGTNPRLPELFELTDYLIMDFKHHSSEKLREYTGAGNETVLANLKSAAMKRNQLLLRIPLINGFNASSQDAAEFAKLLSAYMKDGFALEVLRYHEYGKDKWSQHGMQYTMQDAFVSDTQFNEFCSILKNNSIKLVRT